MTSHRLDAKNPEEPSGLPFLPDGEEPDSVVAGAVEEALAQTPSPDPHPLRTAIMVALTVAAVILLTGFFAYLSLHGTADHANKRADRAVSAASGALDQASQANAAAQTNKQVSDKLSKQLLQHGISPSATAVPVPSAVNGSPGPSGPAGPAPSFASLVAAVSAYCNSTGVCAGKVPTQEQVVAAVSTYCSNGQCRGFPGASGSPGATGASGQPGATVTGPPGDPGASGGPGPSGPMGPIGSPSQDQVNTAVGVYCDAHGGCAGAPGPSGPSGPQGEPGTSCPSQRTVTPGVGIGADPATPYVVCVPSQ